jgi:hypothetical protein
MRAGLSEVLEGISAACQSYGEKIYEMAGHFAAMINCNIQLRGYSVVPDDHVSNLRGVGKHASCGTQAN